MKVLSEDLIECVTGGELVIWPIPGQGPMDQWTQAQHEAYLRWRQQNEGYVNP